MSKPKSKPAARPPERRLFSGPELAELLDRVMTEHGEHAAIAEVKRVRSGGLAGFFCREEFEVVVDEAVPDETGLDGLEAEPEPEREPEREREPEPEREPEIESGPESESGEAPPDELGFRDEPIEPPDQVFAGPTAPDSGPAPRNGNVRFEDLLARRIDEYASTERALGSKLTSPVAPPTPAPIPVQAPLPAAVGATAPAAADVEGPVGAGDGGHRPAFWQRLGRARDELSTFLPTPSPITVVVGPLPQATSVVRRLRSSGPLTSADVVVFTDRAGIAGEPSWELVRAANRLVDRVSQRAERCGGAGDGEDGGGAGPLIVIIDGPSDPPQWVTALQHRLRVAGAGLFHYAVAGQPTGAELERHRQGTDVPYAIDLVSRVDPIRVAALVADRHPIVSVAGVDLSSELLVALRRHLTAPALPEEAGRG